jgi:ribosomal protein S18 acetylase RimI-like enzyme
MLADFAAEIVAGRVVVIETAGGVNGYMIAWPEADAYFIDNIAVDPECQGKGLGRHLIVYAATEAKRLRLPAVRLYTNVMMTENLSMYAHIGFVETHRAVEKGFHRVYMRWNLFNDDEPPW